MKVVIDDQGTLTAIYSDELVEAGLLDLGQPEIRRASLVEPCEYDHPEQWTVWMLDERGQADLSLGHFRLRSDALAAEVKFLEERMFA